MNVLDSVWLEQSKKDKIIKEIILTADFETAYYTVCKYITCRSLQPLHASIIHNVSDNQASMVLLPVDMVSLPLVMWISVSQRYSGTRI